MRLTFLISTYLIESMHGAGLPMGIASGSGLRGYGEQDISGYLLLNNP
jgi:hypothetical protein